MALEVIGTVAQSTGEAVAVDRNGIERPLQPGDKVYAGETIKTDGLNGIEVRLNDGRVIDSGRASELLLNTEIVERIPANADVESIQAAIAAGADPTEVTEPPAAIPLEDDGFSTVRIPYAEPRGNVENGFDTTGISFNFQEARNEVAGLPLGRSILSQQTILSNETGTELSIRFTITGNPETIQEGSAQAAVFTISRSGGVLDEGIVASVRVTAPFEDGDAVPGGITQDLNQSLVSALIVAAQSTPGVSFDPQTGILAFTGNASVLQFTVTAVADNLVEGIEDIVVNLTGPSVTGGTASIVIDTANVDIIDNPPAPLPDLTIDDVTVTEGVDNTIIFTVSRSGNLSQSSTVDYTVLPGMVAPGTVLPPNIAVAPTDYTANDPLAGTLIFAAGEASKTITLNLVNDGGMPEPTEQFTVNLNNPTNATIVDGTGIGTIRENPLNVSILPFGEDLPNQQQIFTFVDIADPMSAYSKQFIIGFQGIDSLGKLIFADANFFLDPGFDVDASADYLVALEDASPTPRTVTGFSSITVEGITIFEPPLAPQLLSDQPDLSKPSAITAVINPNNGIQQNLTLSIDHDRGRPVLNDSGGGVIHYLNGLGGRDTLNGSSDTDVLNGGGGSDFVFGNGGNDILVYDANDAVLNGGAGIDLLRIDSSADLRTKGSITNIEGLLITDDLNSDPAIGSTVQLNAQDVLNFTDSGNSLFIVGNDGDHVILDNAFAQQGAANPQGFVNYTALVASSQVSVSIEQSIDVTIV